MLSLLAYPAREAYPSTGPSLAKRSYVDAANNVFVRSVTSWQATNEAPEHLPLNSLLGVR